ncbi:serine carboxypeptidase-like 51 [Impatiens glandulifera]|uniref:serine carboxypeptidase-like 51 n=1 Tax=Impatiens glandulifera TaxID=253017 RepID=UPI001FB08F9D|nr:serine carboxypeptidase-like 51 [Impatiens glandulifera]
MTSMYNFILILSLAIIASNSFVHATFHTSSGTDDGSEQWGYVEVRPKAHMFWWLYRSPQRVEDPSNPWPIILWLQGGPGGSGVGFGNFGEIGPLDEELKPRNSTWLTKADLLFVDNPVGTGYSYVDDTSLVVKTDEEAAQDLTTLLKALFNGNETLQKSPVFIVAESYGGKFAVTLALSAAKAIENGQLKLRLGGVALGDSWISPEHFVFSWGPILKDMSRLDDIGLKQSISLARKIKKQLAIGKYEDATQTWGDLEDYISSRSNFVDFYNFMLDSSEGVSTVEIVKSQNYKKSLGNNYYYKKVASSLNHANPGTNSVDLGSLMNGPIRQKLKIIPSSVTWGGQSDLVFTAMMGDFMKPRIHEVDELLAKGINVTIYNGQVDLICSTKGTEAWVKKLKWDGLNNFLNLSRTPLYCGQGKVTKGFFRSYKNLFFYWILGAGHFVPVEQPCVSLEMVGSITQSPNK